MKRGDIFWTDLPEPRGSEPGFKRPVLVIQGDHLNGSKIATVVALMFTTNLNYRYSPTCILLHTEETGLPKNSILNCTQIYTIDRPHLTEHVGTIEDSLMAVIGEKLRGILDL